TGGGDCTASFRSSGRNSVRHTCRAPTTEGLGSRRGARFRMTFTLRRKPRTKMVSPDDRMTLTEHLAELRSRIIRALLAVVIGVIILLAFYDQVLNFLRGPYNQLCADNKQVQCDLIFIGPLEGLTT